MSDSVPTSVIEAAREIVPVIRERRDEAERERRLSQPVLDALHGAGLLRMFTPRSLGGLEAPPITRALVSEELAGHDTAAAWTLFNPLDWAYLCARLPDEGAEEIYGGGPDILIAAQFGRPLKAVPTGDGYRITGQAPFVSNCYDADWIATTAMVTDGDARGLGEPEMLMAYLRREECRVIDTWNVLGMRGTGSHDVAVTDVFVPAARTFPMVPEFEPGTHYQGPLYRFPLVGISATSLPPVMLGVARQALDYVSELARSKTPVGSSTSLRERASAQATIARAEAALRSGRLLLYETLSAAWDVTLAGDTHSLHQRADLALAMAHSAACATETVELAYGMAGTSGFRTESPLERHFRDIQVLKQHAFAAKSRYETVGQVLLGLPPDFPALAF